jgi:prevent-host-death family protein
MKTIGLFEAKTKLSQICEEVAKTHVPVTITRRGKALVCIEPVTEDRLSIKERRAVYDSVHGGSESNDLSDFEPAARSRDQSTFEIEE